ncbi:bifunctional nicotinamidase/pyrazinamidase [Nannocystis bainbridge]|uniref:nicotinamidase n=1 Tax=Nannocystis bainbridge TaxID=2995303 RepID=A0ABT5DSJ0_9BACT|nr:bifunctional nicotinamidase/pyrazinamidase [Nannocystis bainbridge]MDC0716034.1 bifunctional nicotinamidase/pyrazinamidase [Nannocystis bainbridge]
MRALILVDIQNDFLPGGALAVPEGDRVIAVANALMPRFPLVVATQDWHPPEHGSFAANHPGRTPGEVVTLAGLQQVLWPMHCVQGTPGAEFADGLRLGPEAHVFVKGVDPAVDSYSGFFDNGRRRSTGLGEFLRARAVVEAVVLGLATDYCVKFTALDALSLGLTTTLVEDGCRGVELQPGDVAAALDAVRAAGGVVRGSADLLG